MPIDPKQADTYLRDLLQSFETKRDELDPHTRRLIIKYKEAQAKGEQLTRDIDQMKNQIKQAEARTRTLELQAADTLGKAAGYLEFLVSMKFEEEPAVPVVPTQGRKAVRPVKTEERKAS
jgi:hypothetical protein